MNKIIRFDESEKFLKIKNLVENVEFMLVELKDDGIKVLMYPSNDIQVKFISLGKDGYFGIKVLTDLKDRKDIYPLLFDTVDVITEYLSENGFDTNLNIKIQKRNFSEKYISRLSDLESTDKILYFDMGFLMKDKPVYESLPRENSVKQLERIMKLSSKTDIGNRISDMNKEGANIEYIQNPIDNGIESFEDYEKNKKVKHKTHIKQFNESLSNNLLEFCKYNLAFLLDDGFEIDLYTYNGIEISKDHGFYWDEIKDEFIPFFEMLNEKYYLVKFNRGGEDSVISFDDGGGADHYSYENVINDEIGDDMLLLKISFRAE